MRISDWSSDVCSSDLATFLAAEVIGDLRRVVEGVEHGEVALTGHAEDAVDAFGDELIDQDAAAVGQVARAHVVFIREGLPLPAPDYRMGREIGRASCGERVCQSVYISVVAVALQKN